MTLSGFFRRIGRSVLLYAWFIGLSALTARLLDAGFLSQYRAIAGWRAQLILWIGSIVLAVLVFNSCLRQFALNDTVCYQAWVAAGDLNKPRWRDAALATVKSPPFLCETVVLIAMIMALPTGIGWKGIPEIAETYPVLSGTAGRIVIGVLLSVLATLLNLFAHVSAKTNWLIAAKAAALKSGAAGRKQEMAPGWRRLLLRGFLLSVGYAFAAYSCATVAFAVGGVLYTLAGFLSWQVVVVLVLLLLLLLGHRYLRALRAVKRFKKELKVVCREMGYTCSDFSRLYRSIFSDKQCGTFSVEAGGKRYACCIVSAVSRYNRLLLNEGGCVHEYEFRLFRRTLFRYYHGTAFRFPAEGERIVIAHPTPYSIIIQKGNVVREGETGDQVGSYTLYTAKNFLGCLSRDCLGKH